MSLPPETVKIVAEEICTQPLSDEVAQALAPDVEFRIRELVEGAIKFMRHSKRRHLTVSDISNSIRCSKVEGLYGHSTPQPMKFSRVPGCSDLFIMDDKEVDFKDILASPLPNPSNPCLFTSQWLCIEGVEVKTGTIIEEEKKKKSAHDSSKTQPRSLTKAPIPSDMIKICDLMIGSIREPYIRRSYSRNEASSSDKISSVLTGEAKEHDSFEDVEMRNPVLPKTLEFLRTSHKLQSILPTFILFTHDETIQSLGNFEKLDTIISSIHHLLQNEFIHIEPYIQQLIPPILTCTIGRRLNSKPTDDHWSLRDKSAKLLTNICRKYAHVNRQILPRMIKTLTRAVLDPLRPLCTHYGALSVLGGLGSTVIKFIIFPNLRVLHSIMLPHLSHEEPFKRHVALKAHHQLMFVCAKYFWVEKPRGEQDVLTTTEKTEVALPENLELLSRVLLLDEKQMFETAYELFGEEFVMLSKMSTPPSYQAIL